MLTVYLLLFSPLNQLIAMQSQGLSGITGRDPTHSTQNPSCDFLSPPLLAQQATLNTWFCFQA